MRRLLPGLALCAVGVAVGQLPTAPQTHPDFSGIWVLERIEGRDQGDQGVFSNEFTIEQDLTQLTIQIKGVRTTTYGDGRIVRTPQTSRAIHILDGKEHVVQSTTVEDAPEPKPEKPPRKYIRPDGTPLGRLPDLLSTSTWQGGSLRIVQKAWVVVGSMGTDTVYPSVSTLVFSLTEAGRLVIDVSFEGNKSPAPPWKSIYRKKSGFPVFDRR